MTYCDNCDRYFPSWGALYQHKANSSYHAYCQDCDREFPTWKGLQQHWVQSRHHSYCERCNEHFDDDDELEDHYVNAHFWCEKCRKFFTNDYGLKEHYRQSPVHHYCASCDRHFLSSSNLQSHLNSSIHRPRDIPCRGKGCNLTFVSVSAMLLHLESGTCISGMNRRFINDKVRELDRNNIITDPSRMLTGPSHPHIEYYATGAAWNGRAYECYLCHGEHTSLKALNQHLASSRHQEKIYVCPMQTCRVRFTALSALCQHIESQRCGVHKFAAVRDTMDGVVRGMARLTF
ncbi:putative zinc-finger of C2H2 type [Lyophyllum shimeji]|uniref:Zinc-finger of C2H2 type n=1 Tax=Lyophyllum shimeji TaxID=47721 RepID=A0A9P3PYL2_LYOSH|nr:putative zinc-finger of C2H2 type [Lyophyllum shimeji]